MYTDSLARRSLRGTIRPSKSDCSNHESILTIQQKRDLYDQVGEEGLKGGAGPGGGGGGFGGGFPGGGGGGFSGFNAGDPNDIFK
jgi:DnaJ-class molecular chaperone